MQANTKPTLLICIPAYNEASIIEKSIKEVVNVMARFSDVRWNILVVDNGSSDDTAEKVESLNILEVSVMRLQGKGKGLAVRSAAMVCEADVFGYIDADLSASPKHIPEFVSDILDKNYQVVIGSRLLDVSRTRRDFFRSFSSRLFNFFRKRLLPFEVKDSQCGMKFMDAAALRELRACRENGWFFDIEFLARVHARGFKLLEKPIDWDEYHFVGRKSKLSMLTDGIGAFFAVLRIRRQILRDGLLL